MAWKMADKYDDLRPAGTIEPDEEFRPDFVNRIICEVIRQALEDSKTPARRAHALLWLRTTGRAWIEDLGIDLKEYKSESALTVLSDFGQRSLDV